jgi:hypothetical protein
MSGQPDLDRFFHHHAGQNQFRLGAVAEARLTQRIASGRPGEPVAPLKRTGVKTNRNS